MSLCLCFSSGVSQAAVLDFEDYLVRLTGADNPFDQSSMYGFTLDGLSWGMVSVLDFRGHDYCTGGPCFRDSPSSGDNALVPTGTSGYHVTVSASDDPSFDFNSAFFSGGIAWGPGEAYWPGAPAAATEIFARGFISQQQIDDDLPEFEFLIQNIYTNSPVEFVFDWQGLVRLDFDSTANTTHFAIDDFTFNETAVVPLPATLPMMLSAILSFGFLGIRGRKQS